MPSCWIGNCTPEISYLVGKVSFVRIILAGFDLAIPGSRNETAEGHETRDRKNPKWLLVALGYLNPVGILVRMLESNSSLYLRQTLTIVPNALNAQSRAIFPPSDPESGRRSLSKVSVVSEPWERK